MIFCKALKSCECKKPKKIFVDSEIHDEILTESGFPILTEEGKKILIERL